MRGTETFYDDDGEEYGLRWGNQQCGQAYNWAVLVWGSSEKIVVRILVKSIQTSFDSFPLSFLSVGLY